MAAVDLDGFERFEFDDGRFVRPVYRRGTGPAVIVIHEMPGLHPLVLAFAERLSQAGMSVWCPSLFGEPGRPVSQGYLATEFLKALCVRREFHIWPTDRSSPIGFWSSAAAPSGVRPTRSSFGRCSALTHRCVMRAPFGFPARSLWLSRRSIPRYAAKEQRGARWSGG